MGDARRKRERFKASHPFCCFCGGETPFASIDHIPSRACFRGKQFPETFEFPACDRCQNSSRNDELVFAFYARALDHNEENYDERDFDRLINGLLNNAPEYVPVAPSGRRMTRNALGRMGLSLGPGQTLDNVPLIQISSKLHDVVLRYARKIALALYYREQGVPAKASHQVLVSWFQSANVKLLRSSETFLQVTPFVTVGRRDNVDIGNQFAYRCNKSLNPDVFAAMATFGSGGILLQMLVVEQDFAAKLDQLPEDSSVSWMRVSDVCR